MNLFAKKILFVAVAMASCNLAANAQNVATSYQRTNEMKKIFSVENDGSVVYEKVVENLSYSKDYLYVLAKTYLTDGKFSSTYIEVQKDNINEGVVAVKTGGLLHSFRNYPRKNNKSMYWDVDVYITYTLQVDVENNRARIRFITKDYTQKVFTTDIKHKLDHQQYAINDYPITSLPPYKTIAKENLMTAVMVDAFPKLCNSAILIVDDLETYLQNGIIDSGNSNTNQNW